jgi:hypothetical protein
MQTKSRPESVAFESVEFLVGETGLMQSFLRPLFSFPDLHLFRGLMPR